MADIFVLAVSIDWARGKIAIQLKDARVLLTQEAVPAWLVCVVFISTVILIFKRTIE